MTKKIILLVGSLLCSVIACAAKGTLDVTADKANIKGEKLNLVWEKTQDGWKLSSFETSGAIIATKSFGVTSGEYAIIYSETKPDTETPVDIIEDGKNLSIPEETFKYIQKAHKRSVSAVPMNRAGTYQFFYPETIAHEDGSLVFKSTTAYGNYSAAWKLNDACDTDVDVTISFTANKDGFYSLPTPTIATIEEKDLRWGVVPGWYQGNEINKKFHLAYEYAQGLPYEPTICRESTITTMSSLMENKDGVTLAITPTPGQDRNAYEKNESTHLKLWRIGLSHMNKHYKLTPMAYHPVLGEAGSQLKAGEKLEFKFTVSLKNADWYSVYKHAIYDIYKLPTALSLKDTWQSLTDRVLSLKKYCLDDATSLWQTDDFNGIKIGAQSYLGGVHGADPVKKDAVKNSDIGAVWMLATISDDKALKETRLPYIRNFKLAQQQVEEGFFQGAAKGQYYLRLKKIFTEEWGTHFEPIGLTYYTMMDIGNILLFEPKDKELKDLLRLGADKLLQWQKEDGGWVVAYDTNTKEVIYTDLTDLRPTFYGLVIAYRILGDKKYLDAAKKGADWYVKNAVEKGQFLGVCGDVRFVNDFATAQSAQALLDIYDLTKDSSYLKAAKETAKMYTTSIYTHPIPNTDVKIRTYKDVKKVDGKDVETKTDKEFFDWQLNQVGLCFEHGGSMGSAVGGGPILLLSHCGMYVRMYQLTGDKLFLDLARAGALGRDAFINQETKVASYYWSAFDKGSGPFPHHAWWQIGWIMDYLVAEAEMRSEGSISFPRGFITPKVGPHVSMGFAAGKVEGDDCNLVLKDGLVSIDNPNVNYICAKSLDDKTFYVVLMNDQTKENTFNVNVDVRKIGWGGAKLSSGEFIKRGVSKHTVGGFGIKILKFVKN